MWTLSGSVKALTDERGQVHSHFPGTYDSGSGSSLYAKGWGAKASFLSMVLSAKLQLLTQRSEWGAMGADQGCSHNLTRHPHTCSQHGHCPDITDPDSKAQR